MGFKTGIYFITNTVNGKKYVGSAANIKKRWAARKAALALSPEVET